MKEDILKVLIFVVVFIILVYASLFVAGLGVMLFEMLGWL
jgi:hypothetical protein